MPGPIIFPYTSSDLTEEVNRIPNQYGYLNALGWFPNEPKASIYVRLDYKDGQIYVLSERPRGAPGDVGPNDTQAGTILQIPHFPAIDTISVADIDNVLEVINGVVTEASMEREVARKLANIRRKHSLTREFIRIGALKGLIKDGRGQTLYDLYSVFGITQKVIDFALTTSTTDVVAKCEELVDHIMTNLKGESSSGIEVVVDTGFFNAFTTHPKVEKYWLQTLNSAVYAQQQLSRQSIGGNWGRVFDFGQGGIVLREYKGSMSLKAADGTISSQANMDANTGYAVPVGTMNMMRTFDGPAFHMATVNTAPAGDEPIFITTEELPHGAGIDLKSQTNMLALNKRPELAVKCLVSS